MDALVRVDEALLRVEVGVRVRPREAARVPDDRPRRELQPALRAAGLPQRPRAGRADLPQALRAAIWVVVLACAVLCVDGLVLGWGWAEGWRGGPGLGAWVAVSEEGFPDEVWYQECWWRNVRVRVSRVVAQAVDEDSREPTGVELDAECAQLVANPYG